MRLIYRIAFAISIVAIGALGAKSISKDETAQPKEPSQISKHQMQDSRQVVAFPPKLKRHLLRNMRDHLKALDEILEALAKGDNDQAAQIAESRLGMSATKLHGAAKAAVYMPEGMRQAGMALHHAASRFALVAPEEDSAKTYAALRQITLSCVACHAQFRLK